MKTSFIPIAALIQLKKIYFFIINLSQKVFLHKNQLNVHVTLIKQCYVQNPPVTSIDVPLM